MSGTNLLNVYKLIFRVSHDNKNDNLFLENNILGNKNSICALLLAVIKVFLIKVHVTGEADYSLEKI